MSTTLHQVNSTPKRKSEKRYDSEFEKHLMVENLKMAVEIYGKDKLRDWFKSLKKVIN